MTDTPSTSIDERKIIKGTVNYSLRSKIEVMVMGGKRIYRSGHSSSCGPSTSNDIYMSKDFPNSFELVMFKFPTPSGICSLHYLQTIE